MFFFFDWNLRMVLRQETHRKKCPAVSEKQSKSNNKETDKCALHTWG